MPITMRPGEDRKLLRPVVYTVVCDQCGAQGPSVTVEPYRQLFMEGQNAVAAEARLLRWREIKDPAGGNHQLWKCPKCAGVLPL